MMMAARSPAAKPDSSSAAASGSGRLANLPVGEPAALALAVGFDQADFVGPALDRGAQRGAQRFVLRQIEHGFRARGRTNPVTQHEIGR